MTSWATWPMAGPLRPKRSGPVPAPLLERYLEESLLSGELDLLADCLYS